MIVNIPLEVYNAAEAFSIIEKLGYRRIPVLEPLILTDASYAHAYALQIIHGPWPEAESVISKNAGQSFFYARDVLKGRFRKGEDAMISIPARGEFVNFALSYTHGVLKYDIKYMSFYKKCVKSGALILEGLPRHLHDNEELQTIYFKRKVLSV